MVQCCVPFCSSSARKKKTGVGFHEFPVEETTRNLWLQAISRKDFKVNFNSKSSVVCSEHFTSEDYVPGLKIRKLIKGAIPSNFPGYFLCKVPPNAMNRRKLCRSAKVKRPLQDEREDYSNKTNVADANEEELIMTVDPESEILRLRSLLCKREKKIAKMKDKLDTIKNRLAKYEED